MAATNRNRKLPLNEAWKHYWSEFFPGCVDWRADLEGAIRRRLYFPADIGGIPSDEHLEHRDPSWSDNLEVNFQDNSLVMKFLDEEFGKFPLFSDQLIPVLSNWENRNPLDRVARSGGLTDRDRTECRDFFIAVVRNCGNGIRSHLLRELKETQEPKFEICCRQHHAAFSVVRKLPISGLSAFSGINIEQNELTDRLRIPAFSHVHLKKSKLSTSEAGPRGSYKKQDAVSIEKMKELIDQGKARSVLQAAELVAPISAKRETTKHENVVRRLQDRFSQQYPNYSNRRGKSNA